MVQVLEAGTPKLSFGQRLGSGFERGLSRAEEFLKAHQNRQALEEEDRAINRETGANLSGIRDEGLRKLISRGKMDSDLEEKKRSLLGQEKANERKEKNMSQLQSMESAYNAIETLESLIDKPGIGLLGQLNASDESRENRGFFESTTAALLPIFKTLFPRGMTQGEYADIREHYIPVAADSEAKIRGKLKGLRNFIEDKLDKDLFPSQEGEDEEEVLRVGLKTAPGAKRSSKREKRDLTQFYR